MAWYSIGTVESILENMNNKVTMEELESDSRLVINDNIYVFTDEENLNEVKRVYGIEDEFNVLQWEDYDPYEFNLYVENVIKRYGKRYEPFMSTDYASELFGIKLNELSREELMSTDLIELYEEMIERALIDNFRQQARNFERELEFRAAVKNYPDD